MTIVVYENRTARRPEIIYSVGAARGGDVGLTAHWLLANPTYFIP